MAARDVVAEPAAVEAASELPPFPPLDGRPLSLGDLVLDDRLSDEEGERVAEYLEQHAPALIAALRDAEARRDLADLFYVLYRICMWWNWVLQSHALAALQAVPEQSRSRYRDLPVNDRNQARLRVAAIARHRVLPTPHAYRATRVRTPRRRRNVRTGPRRARAPASRSGDPDPEPSDVAAVSARMMARVRRREGKKATA